MTMSTPATQGNSSTSSRRLDLETTRPPASTGTLELAALALDVGLLVLVGTHAEMLDGLTSVLGTTEKKGVGTGGEAGSNLVDGEDLTAGLLDAGTGGGSEAESRNGELGEVEETVVVGDGANDDNGLALVGLRGVLVGSGRDDLGQADRYSTVSPSAIVHVVSGRLTGTVHLGHHKTAKDNLVEGRVGSA
jgi:hypothetical protein